MKEDIYDNIEQTETEYTGGFADGYDEGHDDGNVEGWNEALKVAADQFFASGVIFNSAEIKGLRHGLKKEGL